MNTMFFFRWILILGFFTNFSTKPNSSKLHINSFVHEIRLKEVQFFSFILKNVTLFWFLVKSIQKVRTLHFCGSTLRQPSGIIRTIRSEYCLIICIKSWDKGITPCQTFVCFRDLSIRVKGLLWFLKIYLIPLLESRIVEKGKGAIQFGLNIYLCLSKSYVLLVHLI